ncbi:hypothetical protein [Lacinutrix cladophorae]
MKKIILTLLLSMFFLIKTQGQNLVFIGEQSFPCTETFILKSNSISERIDDLNIVFAKDEMENLIVVSSKLVRTVRISGKLIIYLKDGNVITCIDKEIKDNVDDVATTAYYLTTQEIMKMKKSTIHSIRYQVKCEECYSNPLYEGNYSASNKENSSTDFTKVIQDFFKD